MSSFFFFFRIQRSFNFIWNLVSTYFIQILRTVLHIVLDIYGTWTTLLHWRLVVRLFCADFVSNLKIWLFNRLIITISGYFLNLNQSFRSKFSLVCFLSGNNNFWNFLPHILWSFSIQLVLKTYFAIFLEYLVLYLAIGVFIFLILFLPYRLNSRHFYKSFH